MKRTALATALLFSLSAHAGPADSVSGTVKKLLDIMAGTRESTKISQLCGLVRSDVDTRTIGAELLGGIYSKSSDTDGVKKFQELVPSIIVDEFYDVLQGKGGASSEVTGTVPKGSARVGVKVKIDRSDFVITVLKANNKVVDVEHRGFSMIRIKSSEIQKELKGSEHSSESAKPVSELVDRLDRRGINKCK